MFLCTYCVLKATASSCVTFSVIFATRGSILCSDSGVSFALAIRFFDISINRYTPILDMDGALDTEHSAFSPIKQAVDANQSLLIAYFPYLYNNCEKYLLSPPKLGCLDLLE